MPIGLMTSLWQRRCGARLGIRLEMSVSKCSSTCSHNKPTEIRQVVRHTKEVKKKSVLQKDQSQTSREPPRVTATAGSARFTSHEKRTHHFKQHLLPHSQPRRNMSLRLEMLELQRYMSRCTFYTSQSHSTLTIQGWLAFWLPIFPCVLRFFCVSKCSFSLGIVEWSREAQSRNLSRLLWATFDEKYPTF